MAEKLNTKRVSFSLGIVMGIVSLVCALLLFIAPDGTIKLFGSIFHGLDISQIAVAISWSGAILGTVIAIVLGAIIGWLYAKVYNSL